MVSRLALVLVLTLPIAAPAAALGPSPLQPAASGGVETVDRALAKLSSHKRFLLVAAHPDDEDTQLLALVARQLGGEAAYLSLTRGEGGQNYIGPELGIELGLLRSGELVAARQVDGARQHFARAYDFGYTRSLEETLQHWPQEELVEDVVRVIRRFRPQVVVSTFTPDFGGHGQHRAAGLAAYEAFEVAGRPEDFPHLLAEGLAPWQPTTLFRSTWFDREATTLTLPTGGLDPFGGRSVHQIAMASRSLHRSQNMGRLQELGRRETRLGWVRGGDGPGTAELFGGVDTRLRALARPLPEGDRRLRLERLLDGVESRAREARATLVPERLAEAAPALRRILADLRACRALLRPENGGEEAAVDGLLAEKEQAAQAGLLAAAGVVVDATAPRESWVAGADLPATVEVWNAGSGTVRVIGVEVRATGASERRPATATTPLPAELEPGELIQWHGNLRLPPELPPTIPYFLAEPLAGSLYPWEAADPTIRSEPFGPPPVVASLDLLVEREPVRVEREVVYRRRDPGRGDVRRPLRVVPALEVRVHPPLVVRPVDAPQPVGLEVELRSNVATPVAGHLRTSGWPAAPEPVAFRITEPFGRARVTVELPRPPGDGAGRWRVGIEAESPQAGTSTMSLAVIDYDHLRPMAVPAEAAATITLADLVWPDLRRLGVVRGASDTVPEALQAAGLPVELLGPEALWEADLAAFDAILVGPRAYEVEPALAEANSRFLDYVHGGGLLLVQYQQYPYVEGGFAPYPFTIDRPHDRVTDPEAPARPLEADHPVFLHPNRLGTEDWNGWVQERGLYFASSWDDAYTPLLGLPDHRRQELRGGLLVARYGEGRFIYTGLALFRQLPAGVPGAYRLLANLLALHREGTP